MKYFLTSAISVTKIREPPDVTKPNCVPNTREEKFHFPSPCGTVTVGTKDRVIAGTSRFGILSVIALDGTLEDKQMSRIYIRR